MMITKSQIRQEIIKCRSALKSEFCDNAAQSCLQVILQNISFPANANIGLYISHNNELDLKYLLSYCIEKDFKCYLPVLNNQELLFAEYDPKTDLVLNKYRIAEPKITKMDCCIDPAKLDLVFLPLVAFTLAGQRLGMGGGYYDRTFAFLKNSANNNIRTKLIGAAYALQCVDFIPQEPWDIDIHGIVTEDRFINVNDD